MAEIREPSQVAMEEWFTDIPMDTELFIGDGLVEPVALAESEPEEDKNYRDESEEPIKGMVMRSGSQDVEGESEEDRIADMEPMEIEDTAENVLIEDLMARNSELEERVAPLEEQNLTHQFMEKQYRELAYQSQAKLAEMKVQLDGYVNSTQQIGSLLHQILAHNAELKEKKEHAVSELAELKVKHDVMKFEFNLEISFG